MNENEEFFSPNHKRLLSIATWSKSLSWIALAMNILLALTSAFPYYTRPEYGYPLSSGVFEYFRSHPFDGINLLINMSSTVLRGIIYYLVLMGISLGLNMIVETDINYREQRNAQ